MRHAVIAMTVVLLMAAANARGQSLEGFGGVSVGPSRTITPNLGGTVDIALIPNVHLVGEAGRLGNVLPPVADAIFEATGAGVRASALYADGGVRLVASPNSHVSPYVEATGGMARLTVSVSGLGRIGNALIPAASAFLPHTGPVFGGGGGLMLHAGAVQVDLGYRYKQINPPSLLGTALGLGQNLGSHQVRLGLGVRF